MDMTELINGISNELSGPAGIVCMIIGLIMIVVGIIWIVKGLIAKSSGGQASPSLIYSVLILVLGAAFATGGLVAVTSMTNGITGDIAGMGASASAANVPG